MSPETTAQNRMCDWLADLKDTRGNSLIASKLILVLLTQSRSLCRVVFYRQLFKSICLMSLQMRALTGYRYCKVRLFGVSAHNECCFVQMMIWSLRDICSARGLAIHWLCIINDLAVKRAKEGKVRDRLISPCVWAVRAMIRGWAKRDGCVGGCPTEFYVLLGPIGISV